MTWILAARAFVKRIPWQVWAALAVVLVVAIGVRQHGKAIDRLEKAAFDQGFAKAVELGEAARVEREAADATIVADIRSKSNEENRVIARGADGLRVRGPGQARCTQPAQVSIGAGGRVEASGRSTAAATGVPLEDRIALPWAWTVDSAETADLNRAEVLAWREWHKRLSEDWANNKSPSAAADDQPGRKPNASD